MHTETTVQINGSADMVFQYAARVEDWPRLLPHYRGVRVIRAHGNERVVEMRARRNHIPVWWWARQVVLPAERLIRYTHLRGLTRGMEVEWRLERLDGADRVSGLAVGEHPRGVGRGEVAEAREPELLPALRRGGEGRAERVGLFQPPGVGERRAGGHRVVQARGEIVDRDGL